MYDCEIGRTAYSVQQWIEAEIWPPSVNEGAVRRGEDLGGGTRFRPKL